MRHRGKRLAAILGAVALVVCQNGVLEVRAEEPQTSEESPVQEGTDENADRIKEEKDLSTKETEDLENKEADAEQAENKKEVTTENPDKKADETEEKSDAEEEKPADGEAVKEETTSNNLKAPVKAEVKTSEAVSAPAPAAADAEPAALDQSPDARAAQALAVTDLKWDNGTIKFNNPNASKVNFVIHIFKDGKYASPDGKITGTDASAETSGVVSKNLNWCFERYGNGTYTYKVVTFADGVSTDFNLNSGSGVVSGESEAYVYPGSGNDNTNSEKKLQKVENLKWTEFGEGKFTNPNDHSFFKVQIIKDGDEENPRLWTEYDRPYGKQEITLSLYHVAAEWGSGTYRFRVQSVADGYTGSEWTDYSGEWVYTEPDVQLPQPSISVSDGVVSCTLPEDAASQYKLEEDYGFDYVVVASDNLEKEIVQWGNNYPSINAVKTFSRYLTPGRAYYVKVKTLSRNVNKYKDSAYTALSLLVDYTDNSSSDNSADDEDEHKPEVQEVQEPAVEVWKPVTPDEIKRYAAYSREKVEYTAAKENAYNLIISNAMQGKQCFDSFEAVLGDWNIGRTYNILPGGKVAYKADSKASITLNIPRAFQKEGREFRMICVTEKGRPIILNDLDTNLQTITFETDTYYAFALIYKDAAK